MTRHCLYSVRLLLVTISISVCAEANAQRRRSKGQELPQPFLQSVYPAGVERGQSVDVIVRGLELDGPATLWFDDPQLSATSTDGRTFRVLATASAKFGHHEVRVSTRFGISNPRIFVVSDRPEFLEREPNGLSSEANPIELNTTTNGEMGTAADVDYFAFEGSKGQCVFVEIEAERIDSQLDATVRVLDVSGRELAESRDAEGIDPFLSVILPSNGKYFVKVHDATYAGTPNHGYRLHVSDGPRLDAIVTALVHPGETREVTIFGRNLGGTATPFQIDGQPVEQKLVTLTPPGFALSGSVTSFNSRFARSSAASRHGFDFVHDAPTGVSNPLFVSFTEDQILVEAEVEVGDAQNTVVTSPCVISGAFECLNDLDRYRFSAKKGEVFWIEARSEAIGSAAYPLTRIQQILANGEISELKTLTEQRDRGAGLRFGTKSFDCATLWTAPSDGTFQIELGDLFSSQRGDIRLTYQLSLRHPRPGFSVVALPESPNQPDAMVIPRGGRGLGYLLALRTDGFDGPIQVSGTDLPPGLSMVPVVVPSGQSLVPFVIEARADAPLAVSKIELIGRSRFEDRKTSLSYLHSLTSLGVDESEQSLAGVVIWPGGNPADPNRKGEAPARLTNGFVVQVAELPTFKVNTGVARQTASPGEMVAVDFEIERRPGFEDNVAIAILNPFANDPSPPSITIPKAEKRGILYLTLPKPIRPGLYSLVFQGTGTIPFSSDPKVEKKPIVTLGEPSNPVELRIRPPLLKLVLNSNGGSIKAGGELTIDVTAQDRPGLFEASLVCPTALKLVAETSKLASGRPTKLVIKAAGDSPPGAAVGVGLKVLIDVDGETVEMVEPIPLTITK